MQQAAGPQARLSNVLRGRAFYMPFDAIDPTGADDHFVHIHNRGVRPLEIFEVELFSTVAGFVEPFRASGASSTPTAVTVVNLRDEESLPGGNSLFETGVDLVLTVVRKVGHLYLAANTPRRIVFEAGIIIGVGKQLAFNWDAATGILTGHIGFHELPADEHPGGN